MELPTLPLPTHRILVVEDNQTLRQHLVKTLEVEGYSVVSAQDGTAALRVMHYLTPDLIISDINIPNLNGNDFIKEVRKNPLWTAIPFVFLTAHAAPEEIQRGKELGVEDFLTKTEVSETLVKIVNARLFRAAELRAALLDEAYLETVKVLANTIEGRDPYTHGHVERVATYATWLAEALNWPKESLRMLAFGARLHDIGKISVPDHVLKKPAGLTREEWSLIKEHPRSGAKILHNIKHLQPAVPYVLYHHERWDGSGYPIGLKGRDIPIEGRLLAIADVYDALTTTRPYHPARSLNEVFKYLALSAGKHFDPDLVRIYLDVLQEQV